MMRPFSNALFGLALASACMLKSFAVENSLVCFAVACVILSALFTHLPLTGYPVIVARSVGFAGIGGLSLVYMKLSGESLPGATLIILSTVLLSTAVLLKLFADLSYSSQGEKKNYEF